MKKKRIEKPDKTGTPANVADPLAQAKEMVDTALELMSNKLLEALREFDWAKWRRRNRAPRTASLHRLAVMLCHLNQILLPREKDELRESVKRQKARSELAHTLPFLDWPQSNPPSDESDNHEIP